MTFSYFYKKDQTMNFKDYQQEFEAILTGALSSCVYEDPHFVNYTKLNHSRMNRWLKKGELLAETKRTLAKINSPQKWVIISEPWCGDAAHCVPFIVMMAEQNNFISLEIQLRDTNSEIDSYLTNGGKAIPKLIIRNDANEDLAIWGPRPAQCQKVFTALKESGAELDELKIGLQEWYNGNHGVAIQEEICVILSTI
jgi:hypothetical protein